GLVLSGPAVAATGASASAVAVPSTVASASAVAVPTTGEEPAVPSLGIGLLDRPASAAGDTRAERYIVDHVAPGVSFSRRLVIANNTPHTLEVATSVSGASVEDGAFSFEPSGSADDLAEWISLSRPALALEPGTRAVLRATVAVPDDAAAGERYGVIWAATQSPGAGGVEVVSCVGIRIYLSVGAGGEPASDFEVTDLRGGRSAQGQPLVQATVENTGGRAIDVSGELMLTQGPASLTAGPFPATRVVTPAPGDSAALTVLLDSELPAGPWHVQLALTSGRVQRSIEGSVTFPGGGPSAAQVVAPSSVWSHPAYLVASGGLLAAVLLLFLARRRRRPAQADA
ncbi:MAG: hypothetical protein ACOYX5_19635, partial [Actinomycetota bacterium]